MGGSGKARGTGRVLWHLYRLVLDVSAFHILPTGQAGLARWVDPVFFQRAVTNDRYYGALAGAGSYLSTHSPPDAVITVLHEATVVGYYADRNYNMLYTLPYAEAVAVLENTNYLVYDQPVFSAAE